MSGITLQLTGIDEVLRKLDVKKFGQDIADELNEFADGVFRDANQLAPVDEAALKAAIYAERVKDINNLFVEVGCHINYAAYMEFGTRKYAAQYVATLPADWQTFATRYKGPGGGSFAEFIIAITAWVKRKGFAAQVTKSGNKSKSKSSQLAEQQAAYVIARSILRNGVKPHPFLFPAVEKNLPLLINGLRNLFK